MRCFWSGTIFVILAFQDAAASALHLLNRLDKHGDASRSYQLLGRATTNATQNSTTVPLGARAVHGLGKDWMQVNSIYLGFLPDWSREGPISINQALGKSMAIVGDYIDIYQNDVSLSQITYHTAELLRLRSLSVYAPAIRPRFTLDKWTSAMSLAVAAKCAQLNQQGLTVWLRFAWEMNGDWYEYGSDPTHFVPAWKSVADAVRSQTNRTYMLWSPNVRYGDVGDSAGYTQYYPGRSYVDIAGLSFYAPYNNGQDSPTGSFSSGLNSFYKLYGQNHPIVISESAAAMTYAIPSSLQSTACSDCDIQGALPTVSSLAAIPASGASDTTLKKSWFDQLVSDQSAGRYPNLTAVCWFNHFKVGSTHGNDTERLVDFRAVGGNSNTEQVFRQIAGNVSAYQGGYSGHAWRRAQFGSGSTTIALVTALVAIWRSI